MCLYSDIVTVQCTSTYKTTLRGWFLKWGIFIVALFQRGTSHSGTLSKWHIELLFRIIEKLFYHSGTQPIGASQARLGAAREGGGRLD